jgi:NADH-quinone oxidoreductase subunit A
MPSLSPWGEVFLYLVAGLTFVSAALLVSRILRPSRPNFEKLTSYESGEEPAGSPWVQFSTRFYIIALIFLLFEVEVVFLFPWAVVFADGDLIRETDGTWGWFSFVEMMIFVGVLALGLVYAWANGYLDWVRPKQETTEYKSPVPAEMYKKINERYDSKSAGS